MFLNISAVVSPFSKRCEMVPLPSVMYFLEEKFLIFILSVWLYMCNLEWKEGGTAF